LHSEGVTRTYALNSRFMKHVLLKQVTALIML
jgi:hypothetical protein